MNKITNSKAIILLSLVVILAFANTLPNLFVWDDAWVVSENQFIQSFKNFPLLFNRAYLTTPQDYGFLGARQIGSGELSYRPITTLTYFLDYFFWGRTPFGYHLTNVLLHLLNVILLYYLAGFITKNKKIALFAALLFALHPANSEAVAVISFREELLAALFCMVSLILYLRNNPMNLPNNLILSLRATPSVTIEGGSGSEAILSTKDCFTRLRRVRNDIVRQPSVSYILSLIFFLFALFSKETAIVLPIIIILYDFYYTSEKKFKPVYLCYIGLCAFYLCLMGTAPAIGRLSPFTDYPGGNFYTNALTMLGVFGNYLTWAFFPVGVHAIVPDNSSLIIRSFTPHVLFCLVLIVTLLVLAMRIYKQSKIASFSLFWFFIMLLPASNLLPVLNTLMASRFLYLPMVGFCLFTAALIFSAKKTSPAIIIIAILILVCYSALTISRNRVYKDNISLWSEIARFYPDNALAHTDLGVSFERRGSLSDAAFEYRTAIALDSACAKAHFGLGNLYFVKGLFGQAILEYRQGLQTLKSDVSKKLACAKLRALFLNRIPPKEIDDFCGY